MELSKDFDGNAFTVDDDKDDLISPDEGPVIGKGGHVIEARGSVDLQKSKGESSPLSHNKKGSASGKDLQTSHGLKVIVGVAIGFSILVTIALILTIYLGHGQVGASGAVAADVPECSVMGLNILEQGGNAVDAAVSTMFCVGVVNAQSSGIGGGGFMMVHDHKTNAAKVYDFREVAPKAATKTMFGGDSSKTLKGGLSVAVPGELKGMEMAHKKYGKLPWSSVVKPAANLARNGYKVTMAMAKDFKTGKVKVSDFQGLLGNIYLTSDGQFVTEGTEIKNIKLADTLDIIASKGSDAFYEGELVQSIVNAVTNTGGILTVDDLKDYEVVVRDVVKTSYKDQTLISVPAPGGGPVILSIMNILEGYNFQSGDKNQTKTVHRILEAFKFGFAQQQELADPKFESSALNATSKMLDKGMAKLIRNKTTEKTHADPSYYNGVVAMSPEKGTSHISVIDAQELMVSVTTTVNYWFGSKIMTDTGILLNNQMADFADPDNLDTKNNKLNYIAPGKRPLSNMAPVILYNQDSPCKMRLVIGGANGSRIITGVTEVLLNVVSFGLTMADAISAPRIHTQLYPSEVEYEDGFPQKVIDELEKMGHKMVKSSEGLNEVQGIKKVNNRINAVSDYRKGGKAAIFNTNT
ncbi:scoloptoxin SSD14-like isoform X4 [Mytilus trossulus]|uniref:scoloptoxin SSD14-like isoform X1 n=1 Tax=Mytilus trossulus TaxID=6551 RepID=UPI00300499D4